MQLCGASDTTPVPEPSRSTITLLNTVHNGHVPLLSVTFVELFLSCPPLPYRSIMSYSPEHVQFSASGAVLRQPETVSSSLKSQQLFLSAGSLSALVVHLPQTLQGVAGRLRAVIMCLVLVCIMCRLGICSLDNRCAECSGWSLKRVLRRAKYQHFKEGTSGRLIKVRTSRAAGSSVSCR